MAGFSSLGIGLGGGVDVNKLIDASKETARLPITRRNGLTDQVKMAEAKISTYGQIKSLVATLDDTVSKLTSVTGWNAVTATSSDSAFVTASAVGGTVATSFSVEVQGLAKAQNTTSAGLTPPALPVGAGTLRLEVGGKWSADRSTFDLAAGKSPVDIDISATDKLSDVASKINGAKAGVTATIVSDASGERLLLRSNATGEESGFRMTVKTDADGNAADTAGLSRLVVGATTEYGANARAKVNGIDVTSSSNVFANTVAGVTFTAVKETTAPITVTVAKDSSAVKANLENFVKAYNAVNQALNQITAYDKDTQTAGLLQGDTTAVALQNTLRMAIQSVAGGSGNGGLRSLSDVGVMVSKGTGVRPTGDLELDTKKLETALADPDAVKALFRGPDGGSLTDGVAGKIKAATDSLLSGDGFFASKDKLLKKTLDNVQKEITRVEDRADSVEKNLKVRYTALDTQMSRLNALNAYVAQQVTTWNKSSG